MLAEPYARHVRGNLLERSAIFMARFHVERVGLTGPAAHPQEDAMPPRRIVRSPRSQRRQPSAHAHAADSQTGSS